MNTTKAFSKRGGVMRLYRRQQFLQQYGISCTEHILISVGELNKNKNHEIIIRAIAKLKNPTIHYFIAGQGGLREYLEHLAEELGVSKQVHLLGYRNDVVEFLQLADVFCFPSKREGLGLAAIEAMACGLPLITSYIHGIKDYSVSGVTGYSCKPDDVDGFAQAISKMISSKDMQKKMKFYNLEYVKKFSIDIVREQMKILYMEYLR